MLGADGRGALPEMGGMATGCVPLASCLGAEGGGVDNLRSSSVEAEPNIHDN